VIGSTYRKGWPKDLVTMRSSGDKNTYNRIFDPNPTIVPLYIDVTCGKAKKKCWVQGNAQASKVPNLLTSKY
jgi:hypothetical protein